MIIRPLGRRHAQRRKRVFARRGRCSRSRTRPLDCGRPHAPPTRAAGAQQIGAPQARENFGSSCSPAQRRRRHRRLHRVRRGADDEQQQPVRGDEQHAQRQRAERLGAAVRPENSGCSSMCGRTLMPSGMVAKTDTAPRSSRASLAPKLPRPGTRGSLHFHPRFQSPRP